MSALWILPASAIPIGLVAVVAVTRWVQRLGARVGVECDELGRLGAEAAALGAEVEGLRHHLGGVRAAAGGHTDDS